MEGIDATLKKYNLDALVFPGASGAAIAAKAGVSNGNCSLRNDSECASPSLFRRASWRNLRLSVWRLPVNRLAASQD